MSRFKGADKFVFIEDYDVNVGRHLVQGVDVWLNNPRRPLEASGTSGQKVVLNGGLNLSVLDGWWAEAYDGLNGFAIGTGRTHLDMDESADETGDQAIRGPITPPMTLPARAVRWRSGVVIVFRLGSNFGERWQAVRDLIAAPQLTSS